MRQRHNGGPNRTRRLVRKLAAYAAGAAASVAVAEARSEVIYHDFRPNGIRPFELDLDGDTIIDFTSHHYATLILTLFGGGASTLSATAMPLHGNAIARRAEGGARFVRGEMISSASRYAAGESVVLKAYQCVFGEDTFYTFRTCAGSSGAFGIGRGYLGLLFRMEQSDGLHAAWMDVDVQFHRTTLYGYAYQTTPGRSIRAGSVPEPPSLVLLAAGAAGLAMLRRNRAKHQQI